MTAGWRGIRTPFIAYVAPFAAFVAILTAEHSLGWPPEWTYPLRFVIVGAILLGVSRHFVSLRPSLPWASIAVGVAVFALWVAPDLLFGYRHHWLFENAVTGKAATSLGAGFRRDPLSLILRFASSALLVPVLEELFWRGWMMRWLIDGDFLKVRLGTYGAFSFWAVAVLFAAEHGPYWEVGLAAGIVYNWWMLRTRNLGDCVLAHAITNGCLSAYVLLFGQWQYWL